MCVQNSNMSMNHKHSEANYLRTVKRELKRENWENYHLRYLKNELQEKQDPDIIARKVYFLVGLANYELLLLVLCGKMFPFMNIFSSKSVS